MNMSLEPDRAVREEVSTLPIRDLIERYPALMSVLAAHGLDLCCGGPRTVPEAAALHGLDARALLAELDAAQTPEAAG
jgi:iron-sulfur cluster repair protein YtfE (RIC family)